MRPPRLGLEAQDSMARSLSCLHSCIPRVRGCCTRHHLSLQFYLCLTAFLSRARRLWIVSAVVNLCCIGHIAGKWEGVHAFAVRIRDDNLQVVPGVRIRVSCCVGCHPPLASQRHCSILLCHSAKFQPVLELIPIWQRTASKSTFVLIHPRVPYTNASLSAGHGPEAGPQRC